jgi:hypothetical protein
MKSRYHRRKKDKEFDKGGYTMSADFTGRRQPDIDGHTVALLACVHSFCDDPGTHGGEASYAFCALLVKRTAEATAKALDLFEAELQRIGKEKGRCVVRFHTDVDSSFLGAVERHAIRKGWRVTDTGGYNSQSNSVVERRIGLVKQTARAVLLTATGGVGYLQELWGHSMMFANDCVNRNDWGDREAPHTQLTGDSYQWGDHEHCFGEYVLWGVPKENRTNDLSEPGQQGLWMRADPTSSNAAVVVPIAWDADKDCWRLMPTVVATDYTVVKGVFPLRMCPPPGDDGSKFDSFIDAVYDPLMRWAVGSGQPPDEGEASDSGDSDVFYEVEKILNKKTVKGNNMYLIKWKGYGKRHNSWEPETNLNGELLQSFEAARDSHTALLVAAALEPGFFSDLHFEGVEDVLHDTLCRAYAASLHKQTEAVVHDSRKAVEHLMSKQKVGGTVDDWLPGYEAELEKVKRLRLRELEPEEAVRVRKDQLVPRLRMILEAKRDGRRKGRLILQGFLEPYSWDSGVSNDSPVVGMATIRCLLASMRVADVVSARDVSVAFLQSHGYNPDEPKRYVSYTAYKGAVEQVFQLLGPLYGQRSASRRWYETIVGWLTAPPSKGGAGFEQGKNEPCLFRDPVTGLRVVLYVDDLLVVGDAKASRDFHEALGERFSCRDPAEYLAVDNDLEFLGFTITEERVDEVRSVYMDQEDAVGDFLSEFKHQALQLKQSPMPTKTLFHSDPTPLSENAAAVYRHAVGTLNYFARTTRFDIAYAVSRLSSKMSQPDMGAHKSLVHLLGYLLATRQFRIGGELKDTCGYIKLQGFKRQNQTFLPKNENR